MSAPTELELAVARAIAAKLTIGMHPWPEIHGLETAARAALAEAFRWRPIETLPDTDEALVWCPDWEQHTIGWKEGDKWWMPAEDGDVSEIPTPSHWLPLPPPPDEGDER